MSTNVHLPATAVATHDDDRVRTGKVHRTRSGKPATASRNRQQYRVACGVGRFGIAYLARPVRVAPLADLCRSCWTDAALDAAKVTR